VWCEFRKTGTTIFLTSIVIFLKHKKKLRKNLQFVLHQKTKSVTIDLSVKAADKSARRTVFDRLEHKPNFLLAQQILMG
jgi:hypothetical protein